MVEETNFCSTCGMGLTAEGKCSGCNMSPDECTCKQSENQPGAM